jgi:hypothetical protein
MLDGSRTIGEIIRGGGGLDAEFAVDMLEVLHAQNPLSATGRATWAQLIRKIYAVDPLTCPKCSGTMRIIAFIQDHEPVRTILKHLNLWDYPRRAPPRKVPVPVQQLLFPRKNETFSYPSQEDYEEQRAPALMAAENWEGYHADPDTPIEYYAIDPVYEE